MSDVAAVKPWPGLTKTYVGTRGFNSGGCVVMVSDGQGVVSLKHHVRHSPDGFEWGYAGSGPAELARCLLADFFGFHTTARIYQRFKAVVVQNFAHSGWSITGAEIDAHVRLILAVDLKVVCPRCGDDGRHEMREFCNCPAGDALRREEQEGLTT